MMNSTAITVRNEWETTSYKSWAQQTEESYHLQLALALRFSSDSSSADDPNFLDLGTGDPAKRFPPVSASVLSHRFWVNGCLSYHDRVPDGFYLIHGLDPYVWTISTNLQESGQIPSFESLKVVKPCDDLSIQANEAILFDRFRDPALKELEDTVVNLSCSWFTREEAIFYLAELVCNRMGGVASTEECFDDSWQECTTFLKDGLHSIVLPIGSLSVGLCVHRAILFKVLADIVNLPCRIAKGCKYCGREFASSCLVLFGPDREYLVDLIGRPGFLCQPDSMLNGNSSISVSSPLCHPRFRTVEDGESFKKMAERYFSDSQSLDIQFDDASSGTAIDQVNSKENPRKVSHFVRNKLATVSSSGCESSILALPQRSVLRTGYVDVQQIIASTDQHPHKSNKLKFMETTQLVISYHERSLFEEDLDIEWSDLDLKEKIGRGSFGTVHRARWHGVDVAVKILMEQDFHADSYKEFLVEVSIMKSLQHRNIVLFLGAITEPPKLSIVTEYLSRGSLYKLLQMPDAGEKLDYIRCLNMAYDVAEGMNYLHQLKPPIVHRDLKSPNLLVDDKYTVKVCDFGLSRTKANTFLSSKTAGGTPEGMAPEVLRNEYSNEKSDVYSFGVILWELMTLQQPWRNINQSQVVYAVGFMGNRLEIPAKVNPQVAALIEACWINEPMKRPSFSSIMKYLQRLIVYSSYQQTQGRVPQITSL